MPLAVTKGFIREVLDVPIAPAKKAKGGGAKLKIPRACCTIVQMAARSPSSTAALNVVRMLIVLVLTFVVCQAVLVIALCISVRRPWP
eukprot:5265700-Amphidinium_carterae.1